MDNGYTKISNDILDAMLRYGFTQTQLVVLLYILRKTVGWNKPSDHIAISQIAADVGKKRQLISRVVSDLEKMGVLNVARERNGKPPELSVNRPSEWDEPATVQFHVTTQLHETTERQNLQPYSFRGETVELQEPATVQFHTKENKRHYTKEKKKEPSAPISEDETTTMFEGRITVAEYNRLSPEEQAAMDEEYWGK